MNIAAPIFRGGLPILVAEAIDVYKNFIEVHFSNDILKKSLDNEKNLEWTTVTYVTSNLREAIKLSSDPNALIKFMRSPHGEKNVNSFGPDNDNFKMKTYANRTNRTDAIYSYKFSKKFKFKPSKKKNLYLILAVVMAPIGGRAGVSWLTRETVMAKGLVPLKTNLFTLAEASPRFGSVGNIYPGPAHLQGNNVMAGATHISAPHPLLGVRPMTNQKVRDLRVIDEMRSIDLINQNPGTRTFSYTSEILYNRNSAGILNGYFTFNLNTYSRYGSKYGGVYSNQQSLSSVLSIKDINIYRRRVSEQHLTNKLTPGISITCGPPNKTGAAWVASLGSGAQFVNTRSVSQTFVQIAFVDEGVADFSGGTYEYAAEIIFNDETGNALKHIVSQLKAFLKTYKQTDSVRDAVVMLNYYVASVSFILGAKAFKTSALNWRKNLAALVHPLYSTTTTRALLRSIIEDYISRLNALTSSGPPTKAHGIATKNYESQIYHIGAQAPERYIKIFKETFTIRQARNIGINYLDNIIRNKKTVFPMLPLQAYKTRTEAEAKKYQVSNPRAASIDKYSYLSPQAINLGNDFLETTDFELETEKFLKVMKKNPSLIEMDLELQKSQFNDKMDILASAGISVTPLRVDIKDLANKSAMVTPKIIDSSWYFASDSGFILADTENTLSDSALSIIVTDRESDQRQRVTDSAFENNLINNIIGGLVGPPVATGIARIPNSLAYDATSAALTTMRNGATLANPIPSRSLISNGTNKNGGSLQHHDHGVSTDTQEDELLGATINSVSSNINFGLVTRVEILQPQRNNPSGRWITLTEQKFDSLLQNRSAVICRLVSPGAVVNTIGAFDKELWPPLTSVFILGNLVSRRKFIGFQTRLNQILESFDNENDNMIVNVAGRQSGRPTNPAPDGMIGLGGWGDSYYCRSIPFLGPSRLSAGPAWEEGGSGARRPTAPRTGLRVEGGMSGPSSGGSTSGGGY